MKKYYHCFKNAFRRLASDILRGKGMNKENKNIEIIVLGLILVFVCFFAGFICGFAVPKYERIAPEEDTTENIIVVTTEAVETTTERSLLSLGEFVITAYCPCEKCCGVWGKNRPTDGEGKPIIYTASGEIAKQGVTIAVDPDVIPYGTQVIINGHEYIAQDCGGSIQNNKIDIYFSNHEEANKYGEQTFEVFICE